MASNSNTEAKQFTPEQVEALAELAVSNHSNFLLMKALIDPELVKLAEERLIEKALEQQIENLKPLFVGKDERPENFDELVQEFLFCMNRGSELMSAILESKLSNSVGNNAGQKRERKVKFQTREGDLEFKVARKLK